MTSAHVVRKLIGAMQRNISQLDKNGVTDSVMRTEEYFVVNTSWSKVFTVQTLYFT